MADSAFMLDHLGAALTSIPGWPSAAASAIPAGAHLAGFSLVGAVATALALRDALLPSHARRESIDGTRHLNFHDLAGLAPWLKFTPVPGRTSPSTFLTTRNAMVRHQLQSLES